MLQPVNLVPKPFYRVFALLPFLLYLVPALPPLAVQFLADG
jgi:hypothetical protein